MIKIHHAPRARGVRVIWQCEEMGLPYEIAPVAFPPGEAFKSLNPIGSVPFLEDDGGVAINESVGMMLYLANRYGPTPLLPGKDDPAALARAMQFAVFGEATLGMWINVIMIARFFAPEDEKENFSVQRAAERVQDAVDYTARQLGSDPYIAGKSFTLADISVSYALGIWSGFLGRTLPDTLNAYQARMAERPAFQKAIAS